MKLTSFASWQRVTIGSLIATLGFVSAALANPQPMAAPITPSKQVAVVPPSKIAADTTLAAMTQSIFNQVNQYRKSKGLAPLKLDASINQQSLIHSRTMASQQKLSHDGFQQRTNLISRSVPLLGAAENVAYNMGYQDPATVAVQGWIKSPGHRKNMEGNYNLTGIGIVKTPAGRYYMTQIFVRRR